MSTPAPRRRKSADASASATVKTSLSLSREMAARLAAASTMAGMSANAFVLEALSVALRGVVIHDRRKTADVSNGVVRLVQGHDTSFPDESPDD